MTRLHIADLFDPCDLDEAIENGFVRVQVHPDEPLKIYNYTERAQFAQEWNDVTLACRGLIVDDSGWVRALPFGKFFNYGQEQTGPLDLNGKAVVVDKMDGSLGILYPTPVGWSIATRGSFTSDQAKHATDLFHERYKGFEPPSGVTALFEIVFPENRIVCDYGGLDDLILLGGVDMANRQVLGPQDIPGWDGPSADVFVAATLGEALAMPPRAGAEGLVVRMVETGQMVKIKQSDYVELHKVITGLNARIVWEALGNGRTIADLCEPLPDEFHQWVRDLAVELREQAEMRLWSTQTTYGNVREKLDQAHADGWQRKEFAIFISRYVDDTAKRAWLFNLLDGKDPYPAIWKSLRPSGDRRPVNFSEDTA
ncbi:hypothetical protein [Acrocarpospora sp. B8E8]|uniref:hypothetical protein n=1 Tax=Acrocarpospora sp. B8E8 TaxID=3153572 RepID=UPI00325EE50C